MGKIAEVREVTLTKLVPYERNAKKHSLDQIEKIAAIIEEFGFVSPCLIDQDYNIIAGHGRVLAAEFLGLEKVPCVFIEGLTDEQRRAYILADNRLTELGDWDMELVDLELADLDAEGFDVSLTGFDWEAVTEINTFDDEYEGTGREDIDIKAGDVFQLGEHRLMCGDSTDPDDVKILMDGALADIAVTSPPYGLGDTAKLRDHYVPGAETRKTLYRENDDATDEWADLIGASFRTMQGVTHAQFVNVQMLAGNKRDMIGWVADNVDTFCDVIIWDKGPGAPQMHDNVLNNRFEFVFVFSNDNNSRVIPFAQFHGNESNVIEITHGTNEFADIHGAVFPVELPAKIIRLAKNAQSVLDPFGGTGTTLIACEQLDRKCYMMELDPYYISVIIDRWEQFTGEKAVKL